MRNRSLGEGALVGIWLFLLLAASLSEGDDKNVIEVVGIAECADCSESNIKTIHAFSGLQVSIDCKPANGELKTRGVGELDEEGKFKVSLPKEIILGAGKLKEECFAQLHSASAAPCATHGGLKSSKIVFKSQINGKYTFSSAGKLKFSPATCTSALLSHFPKLHLPPFKIPLPPPIPIHKKPLPPHVPIYKPKPPIFKPPVYKKPLPPHVPIYKPKPPILKPPVYKKPLPPLVPIYKPKPPIFKPPIYKKPLPPHVPIYIPKPLVFKHPPIFKKPLPPPIPVYKPIPPISKPFPPYPKTPKKPYPPVPKLPPMPKIPKLPPLPPHFPLP